jgi:DNA-binding CsgD family transcriptional regulator
VIVCANCSAENPDNARFCHACGAALELATQVRVVRSEQPAHVLGIELLGAGGEADQIGEEHRHDLALFTHRRGGSLQPRAARVAEPGGVRILSRAARADDHALSVRGGATRGYSRRRSPANTPSGQ